MNTVKNNKNIAIYMGGKTSDKSRVPIGHQNIWLPIHGVCRWDTVDVGKGKILRYHKSWDWLIPVISKITSDDMYPKYVDYSSSMISEGGVYINTKFIDATYNNVVDFIDWYNKHYTQHYHMIMIEDEDKIEAQLAALIQQDELIDIFEVQVNHHTFYISDFEMVKKALLKYGKLEIIKIQMPIKEYNKIEKTKEYWEVFG